MIQVHPLFSGEFSNATLARLLVTLTLQLSKQQTSKPQDDDECSLVVNLVAKKLTLLTFQLNSPVLLTLSP